jgi:Ca2+-binding EF-hand superfamily protein
MSYTDGEFPPAAGHEHLPPPPGAQAPTPAQLFTALDTNSDGSLSLAEFTAGLPMLTHHPAGDGDSGDSGDGGSASSSSASSSVTTLTGSNASVTPSGQSATPPTPAQLFAEFDTNSDGGISLAEFTAGLPLLAPPPKGQGGDGGGGGGPQTPPTPAELFAEFDTNDDLAISIDEFVAGLPLLAPPPNGQQSSTGPTSGNNPSPNGQQGTPPTPQQLFAEIDTNANGSLDLAEFTAGLPLLLPPHPGPQGGTS